MEREYVFWRTGIGCSVFIIGNVVAVVVVVALLPWLPRHPLPVTAMWGLVFFPFLRLASWADRRRTGRRSGS